MSHHINAIVTKRTDRLKDLCYRSLPQGFALLIDTEENHKALEGQDFATIWTDYFGGPGEQGCILFLSPKGFLPPFGGSVKVVETINDGLKVLGVIAGDSDEFDAIILGRYRHNEDISTLEERV